MAYKRDIFEYAQMLVGDNFHLKKISYSVRVYQQRDNYNCGVIVMLTTHLLAIVRDDRRYFDRNDRWLDQQRMIARVIVDTEKYVPLIGQEMSVYRETPVNVSFLQYSDMEME